MDNFILLQRNNKLKKNVYFVPNCQQQSKKLKAVDSA